MNLMKQTIFIISMFFLAAPPLAAQQTNFISLGKVEYEKKVNQHRYLEADTDGEDNIWITEQKKVLPRFVSDNYELVFNEEKTSYRLAKENTDNKYLWGAKPSESDVAIQDIKNQTLSVQREVFENTYLISDTARKINWRITNETRTIAGFECKKAVGIICDSVYVVAFYTDEILISAGPESFGGLPGMILGLAVPRLFTTWFAIKVELITPTSTQLNPKQKGKKVTYKQLQTELNKGLKDWGKYGARRIWGAML
jgi:GLPGLI family protein